MYSLESLIGSAFMGLGGALLLIWTFVWLSDKVSTQIVHWRCAMPTLIFVAVMRRDGLRKLSDMLAHLEAREKALNKRDDALWRWERKLKDLAKAHPEDTQGD